MVDQSHDAEDAKNKPSAISLSKEEAIDEVGQPELTKAAKTMPVANEDSPSLGNIKLSGNAKDAEMMKPADLSDPELQNDNEMQEENAEEKVDQIKQSDPDNKIEEKDSKKKSLEQMLAKEFEEQDKKI